jgi:hypothetical protein
MGRIQHGAGARIIGMANRGSRPRKKDALGVQRQTAGWECVHIAIDDCTRLAYAEVLADQSRRTVIGFLRRAVSFYARHGIIVERVMTDNGGAYRSTIHAAAYQTLGIRHLRTRAYRLHSWVPNCHGNSSRRELWPLADLMSVCNGHQLDAETRSGVGSVRWATQISAVFVKALRLQEFRGVSTTLDLSSPLAVLVGENNSGKSIAVDALRMVLPAADGPRAPLDPRQRISATTQLRTSGFGICLRSKSSLEASARLMRLGIWGLRADRGNRAQARLARHIQIDDQHLRMVPADVAAGAFDVARLGDT